MTEELFQRWRQRSPFPDLGEAENSIQWIVDTVNSHMLLEYSDVKIFSNIEDRETVFEVSFKRLEAVFTYMKGSEQITVEIFQPLTLIWFNEKGEMELVFSHYYFRIPPGPVCDAFHKCFVVKAYPPDVVEVHDCEWLEFDFNNKNDLERYALIVASLVAKGGPNSSMLPDPVFLYYKMNKETIVLFYKLDLSMSRTPRLMHSLYFDINQVSELILFAVSEILNLGLAVKDFNPETDFLFDDCSIHFSGLEKLQPLGRFIDQSISPIFDSQGYLRAVIDKIAGWAKEFDAFDSARCCRTINKLRQTPMMYFSMAGQSNCSLYPINDRMELSCSRKWTTMEAIEEERLESLSRSKDPYFSELELQKQTITSHMGLSKLLPTSGISIDKRTDNGISRTEQNNLLPVFMTSGSQISISKYEIKTMEMLETPKGESVVDKISSKTYKPRTKKLLSSLPGSARGPVPPPSRY